jgi:hypothetical protein
VRHPRDYDIILEELTNQGWRVEQIRTGYYRAYNPTDKTKAPVSFSRSGDPRAVMRTVHDLKKAGWLWPPPKEEREANDPDEDIRDLTSDLEDAYRKPEPEVAAVNGSNGSIDPEVALDALYDSLKDAKATLTIARALRDDKQTAFERAKKELEASEHELAQAVAQVERAKSLFDAAFSKEHTA